MDITVTVINDTSKTSNLTGFSDFDEIGKTLTTTLVDVNQFNDLTTFLNSNPTSEFSLLMSFIADPTPTIKDRVRNFYTNKARGFRDMRETIFTFSTPKPTDDNEEPPKLTDDKEPPDEIHIGGMCSKKRCKTPAKKSKKNKKGGKSRKNKKSGSNKRK